MKPVRIAAAVATAVLLVSPALADKGVAWTDWGDGLFARATSEKRFVILDLEAVWCASYSVCSR